MEQEEETDPTSLSEEKRRTSFSEILIYVGGFLAVIALLALVAAWLLRAL